MTLTKMYHRLFRITVLIGAISLYWSCTRHISSSNPPAYKYALPDTEVNAAFSQTPYSHTSPDPELKSALFASSDTISNTSLPPVSAYNSSTKQPPYQVQSLIKENQQDDPPILVKKRVPFWKILLGVLIGLIGIGLTLYSVASLALLTAVVFLVLLFGLDLWISSFILIFVLILVTMVAGIFISIAGYNLLISDPYKRIRFRRRK